LGGGEATRVPWSGCGFAEERRHESQRGERFGGDGGGCGVGMDG
jgi:hypothetical protein